MIESGIDKKQIQSKCTTKPLHQTSYLRVLPEIEKVNRRIEGEATATTLDWEVKSGKTAN
jgi:hypothetical protein